MSDRPDSQTYLKMLVVLAVSFMIAAGLFGYVVLQKLERIVVVSERLEILVKNAMQAAAPLGQAAVEKGTHVLQNVDAEELGKGATEGLQDVGRAAKERAVDWIRKHPKPD